MDVQPPSKTWRIGKYRIPLGKADVRLLRKGRPFWNVLGEHGVFSNIIRVPITFPAEPFRGVLLSAMCVPDLRGSQGTFSFYTTREGSDPEHIGGEQLLLHRDGSVMRSHLVGPENSLIADGGPMRCPFEISHAGNGKATLKICGESIELIAGQYTPWINVDFKAAPGVRVRGICEFLLRRVEPELELYVTPIQIDPAKPALPIAHPTVYSTYLAKNQGTFATLGLAEDTWALNAKILGDEGFLHQCLETDEERERMFFDALDKVRRGLCVCVFDGTDRIQHMFWRYLEPDHPARREESDETHPDAIEEVYTRMDALVGRTLAACDDDSTMLMVISDHGFSSFRRGIDLNVWLEQNGYLTLKPEGRGKKYLAGVDWSQTQAYALGLAGIWLNIKGRESQGIVEPEDADGLRDELCEKLTGLRDDAEDAPAVNRALNAHRIYRGPYKADGPDIIVGYHRGYRVCWETAVGEPTDQLFHDNVKAWSGDHCIDPKLIPGVLFCNRKIETQNPRLMDLGPTVLDLFGVDVPQHMDGKALIVANADGSLPASGHVRNGKSPQPRAAKR